MRLTPRQRASWLAHLFKAVTQQHHRELVPVLAPFIAADAVVLDVGAHAGQFAKLFAAMAPRGRVYAFEPSPYARSILEPALAVGGRGRAEIVPAGLSDRPGELVLHTPIKRRGGLGFGTAHLGGADAAPGVDQMVPLTTLDAFAEARGLSRLDFIKMDIEGWEARALAGGRQTLARFLPFLFLEVDAAMLARAGDDPDSLFRWLGELGYRAFRSPMMRPVDAYEGAGDYLFRAPGAAGLVQNRRV
ncbi:MAG: FkbM family methyltransferase [Proteobacteria bacterium]|nr:FkbM family methyltransferase [Pseudomonadota bacterium]